MKNYLSFVFVTAIIFVFITTAAGNCKGVWSGDKERPENCTTCSSFWQRGKEMYVIHICSDGEYKFLKDCSNECDAKEICQAKCV